MTEGNGTIGSPDPSFVQSLFADPLFVEPFIDIDEWRDTPVRHRYVHGGFVDTDLRFSFYMPPAEQYGGRFHQPVLHVSGTEHGCTQGLYDGMGGSLPFTFASGAYLVESNMGTTSAFPGADATITYRASAAAACYSRVVAAEMYGPHRPYGYVWGGSGGAFKSMACIEATTGVWDGAAPFVQGSPMAIPNVFSVQAHAMRQLWPKLSQIVDAFDPGGGNPYDGLTVDERQALAEATRFGFPQGAWFDANRIFGSYTMLFTLFADVIRMIDPGYYTDFWTVPGYLGANPPESLLRARVQHACTISGVVMAGDPEAAVLPTNLLRNVSVELAALPIAIKISGLPDVDLRGASLEIRSGGSAGRRLYITEVVGDLIDTGVGGDVQALGGIAVGDEVMIDNADYLAYQTYHRHQQPGPEYEAWHQFTVDGEAMYPQRATHIGPLLATHGAGAPQTGRFTGKMIVMQSMLDEAAYAWQADWYRQQAAANLGDQLDDQYRLWFIDHAMHGAPAPVLMSNDPSGSTRLTRTISYRGVLEQVLRDLAAWAEQGISPPCSTSYTVVAGQVVLPATAGERGGIQPVVDLTIEGAVRADVRVGDAVTFTGVVHVPDRAGTLVRAEWDFEGAGAFAHLQDGIDGSTNRTTVVATHAFATPGTYFPALRVASQRQGDMANSHARVYNLGRVRVVVDA